MYQLTILDATSFPCAAAHQQLVDPLRQPANIFGEAISQPLHLVGDELTIFDPILSVLTVALGVGRLERDLVLPDAFDVMVHLLGVLLDCRNALAQTAIGARKIAPNRTKDRPCGPEHPFGET